MRKFCFAFVFALVVCVGSCFALSPDDCVDLTPYSFSSHTVGNRLVDTAASVYAVTGWSDTDRDYLNQIRLALTQSHTGTILGYLNSILSKSNNIYSKLVDVDLKLGDIKSSTGYLNNINNNTNSIVSKLKTDLNGSAILTLLNDVHLDTLAKDTTLSRGLFMDNGYPRLLALQDQVTWLLPRISGWLAYDGNNPDAPYTPTLYHYVKNLSDTLASDDDEALADSQKNNRQQIEQDFLSGSSGKTSLGASDFGDLSSVGGSVKDSISLNGQSSISGFTGGLSDSDEAGQGWFSSSTRDALDTVSPPSTSSSYARRSSDDIYNMAGFAEHYSWLYGG